MNITYGIALGAIISTIINIAVNYMNAKKGLKKEKEENVNILFGELLNVLNHYQFSEIPINLIDGDGRSVYEINKRLKFAKYGEFKAIKNVDLYGFLSPLQVRNIHQLALRIRNTDILINEYLSSGCLNNVEMSTHEEINMVREINSRMNFVSDTSDLLLMYISQEHPEFCSLINETKHLEKPNYEI